MTRRESRQAAVCLIYEMTFSPEKTAAEIIEGASDTRDGEGLSAFARDLFLKTTENLGFIDEKISASADNWRFDRIGRVTLSVLRLAACELNYFPEIPVEITVNEALEISRLYDDEKSVAFVNGVLGKLTNGIEKPDARKKPQAGE